MSLVHLVILVLSIAAISGTVIYLRTREIIEPEKISNLGLNKAKTEDAWGFAQLSVFFGIACTLLFCFLSQYWLSQTPITYNTLGVVLFVLLSILAVYFRSRAELDGIPEVIFLNFIWALGFGLPLSLGQS